MDVALARNSQREGKERIPEEIINRMYSKFEWPQPEEHRWERHSYYLDNSNEEKGASFALRCCNRYGLLPPPFPSLQH